MPLGCGSAGRHYCGAGMSDTVEVRIQLTVGAPLVLHMVPEAYSRFANWFGYGKTRTYVVVGELHPSDDDIRIVVAREHLAAIAVVSDGE